MPDAATLDLARFSRKTQQALYELTVAHFWTPKRMAPPYTPEQAGLKILFWRKRWFASYRYLEDADATYLPAADLEALLRITYDPSQPFGILFSEC